MKKLFTVTTLGLIGVILVAGFYQTQAHLNYSEERAVQTAIDFLIKSPTFNYDGIDDSINLVRVEPIEARHGYLVTLRFTSANSGYGDRKDQIVAPVLTEHTVNFTVVEDTVTEAITDGVFDEIEGQMLPTQIAWHFVSLSPTFSFDGISESLKVVEVTESRLVDDECVQATMFEVLVYFESRHAGYGDRTGEMLLTVITPHEARLVISDGQVLSAVMDGVWDMIAQQRID